ncbi:MAG: hypothetical protein ACOCRO_01795 [Halanaerobiales bacterium]
MTEKFLNKQLNKLEKDLDEGFDDFEEPSDISLTATDAYTYSETGFRKGFRKGGKKALEKQKNNKPGILSTSKGHKDIKGNASSVFK